MREKLIRLTVVLGWLAMAGVPLYAQDHSQHQGAPATSATAARGASTMTKSESIFCPTMNTGQLCSHGTTNVLQVSPDKQDQWLQAARQYNRAVDAATTQLMKDAEGILDAQQMALLKAWFAEGFNREINQLLYSKGLGAAKK